MKKGNRISTVLKEKYCNYLIKKQNNFTYNNCFRGINDNILRVTFFLCIQLHLTLTFW